MATLIWKQHLFHLWTALDYFRVRCKIHHGSTFPSSNKASRKLHKISSSQTGIWVSQVTSPSTLGSAYLYQEISTIIAFFVCVQSNYLFLFSIYTTATSGPAALTLRSSAES